MGDAVGGSVGARGDGAWPHTQMNGQTHHAPGGQAMGQPPMQPPIQQPGPVPGYAGHVRDPMAAPPHQAAPPRSGGRHARPGPTADNAHPPAAGGPGTQLPTGPRPGSFGAHAAVVMRPIREIPEGPPPELRFKRRTGLVKGVRELWKARELVRTLAERDLRARYKQAVLGFAWAILTPVMLMVVFTVVFQRVGDVSKIAQSHGAPYPLFSYVGLLGWTFFMASVTQGASAIVSNGPLLNKVYCPREVFPLSTIIVALFDMMIAAVVLVVLFGIYTKAPAETSYIAPLFLVIQIEVALGAALLLSASVVYFRDIRHMLPLLMQMGMFATPVAYGLDQITKEWLVPYVAANPLAAVIDGYRRTMLYGQQPDWKLTGVAALSASLMLLIGYRVFKKLETGIADVA